MNVVVTCFCALMTPGCALVEPTLAAPAFKAAAAETFPQTLRAFGAQTQTAAHLRSLMKPNKTREESA